jgi:hypothetical protein
VIGHNLGIADESYADLTSDSQPGETVALLGEEIQRFAKISLGIVTGLEDRLIGPLR